MMFSMMKFKAKFATKLSRGVRPAWVSFLPALFYALVQTPTAYSAPSYDFELQELMMGKGNSSSYVTVIAVFKDAYNIPHLPEPRAYYQDIRHAMITNAQESQKKFLSHLNELNQRSGTNIQSRVLPLSNAMIVSLPVEMLGTFRAFDEILSVQWDAEEQIFHPYVHENDPPPAVYTYGLEKMKIPQVHQVSPGIDGSGIVVGVIDTGIDPNHPDLQGKVAGFKDFINNRPDPYDDNRHGTHVSGTIAGGNASGKLIGVAPGAKILSAKVFSRSGSGSTSKILLAMEWMADPDGQPETPARPQIVNNSWGGGKPKGQPKEHAYCRAISGWLKLGILPVFSNGNAGSRPFSVNMPAACPEALAVGATDSSDKIASFSSRGPAKWFFGEMVKPNVSAPGVAVYSSVPGGGHRSMSGTSMAAPHVAGLAALAMQTYNLPVYKLFTLLMEGVEDLGPVGSDNDFGTGRVDAMQTLQKGRWIQ